MPEAYAGERGQLGHSVGAAAALVGCRSMPGLGRDLGLRARSREGEFFFSFFLFSVSLFFFKNQTYFKIFSKPNLNSF